MIRRFYTGIFFIIFFAGCSSKNALPSISCTDNLTEGYTDRVSYLPGESVKVYLHASHPLELCRLNAFNINGDAAFQCRPGLPCTQNIRHGWSSAEASKNKANASENF